MQERKGSSAKVAIICPSLGKSCGIARYSHYVATSLKKLGVETTLMRSSHDLFAPEAADTPFDFILVQHEYGLFDNLSPLGTGETTSTLVGNLERYQIAYPGARSAVIMHTIVLTDHVLNIMNQCLFSSSIPIFNLNSRGCYELAIPHLEHGVFVYEQDGKARGSKQQSGGNQRRDRPTVGSFGLLSPNKKPTLIIDICERAQANFIGNFATNSRTAARELADYAERLKVPATVFTDFCDEPDLLDRLAPMDFGVVTQEPISHWATSGSIRFLFNFGVPVLVPYGPQFEDCSEGVIFAHQDEMHFRIDELFGSTEAYELASERARSFATKYEMSKVYAQFLDLLANNPPSRLTAYRMRNFRDQRRSMTLIDMMLLSKGTSAGDIEAAEKAIVDGGFTEEEEPALHAMIDKQFAETKFMSFSVACEGLISPYLGPADRLNLLTSCATLPSNLFQVERYLGHDDTLPPVVRREAMRDIQGIQREYHEVVSNRIFSASVTGKLVKQLFPDAYGAVGREAVHRLRKVQQNYIDRIGFRGSADKTPIRIPVLLSLPSTKLLSFLSRVGGFTPDQLLDLTATCGLPNDIFEDRLAWVEAVCDFIREKTTAPLSVATSNPMEFHTRYRAYKAEFAMMTTEQFLYSALALFFKSQPSRQRLSEICGSLEGKTRTEVLQILSQQPEATLFQSAVVDLDTPATHEDLPKPVLFKKIVDEYFTNEGGTFRNVVNDQNFFQVSRFWLFDSIRGSLHNDLYKEKADFSLDSKTAAARLAAKAEPLWLPDEYVAPMIAALAGPKAQAAETILFGDMADHAVLQELQASLALSANVADLISAVGKNPDLEVNVRPEPWAKLAAQIPARTGTASVSFKEKDPNAKSMPIFDPSWVGEAVSAGLPDRVWANAWNSISRFTSAKIVGPSEFRRVSPWVIAIDQVTEEDEFDFIIIHKGQIATMQTWLKEEIAKKWQPYFANEVFIIFSKPEVSPLFFDEVHVRVAKDLVPQRRKSPLGKGLGKLLAR